MCFRDTSNHDHYHIVIYHELINMFFFMIMKTMGTEVYSEAPLPEATLPGPSEISEISEPARRSRRQEIDGKAQWVSCFFPWFFLLK